MHNTATLSTSFNKMLNIPLDGKEHAGSTMTDWDEMSISLSTSRGCSSNSVYRPLHSSTVKFQMSHVNMEYLREDGRYLHTSPEELSAALSKDELDVKCEEDVYEMLLDWVYYDLDARKQYFGMLFESLRLAYVPKSYVEKIIKREELVMNDPVSYGAVVQYEKLYQKLSKGVSKSVRSTYGHIIGAPRKCYTDTSILVCGGKDTEKLCEVYCPLTNAWTEISPMSLGRSNAGVFSSGEKHQVCFVGGEDPFNKILNSTVTYDLESGCWVDGVVSPGQTRTGAQCCSLGDKMYLIGGWTTEEGYTNSVERFNHECHRWVPVKSMGTCRFAFGCAEAGGFIYSCGGFDGEKDLKECEFFMPDANEWTPISDMIVPRSGCKTVQAEGRLYCIGGWSGNQIESSCEVYDPRSNRWTMIASMNRPRHGLEVVGKGNEIYAIGGWNGRKKLSSIERYHTRSDTWELLSPMSIGRWLTTAMSIPSAACNIPSLETSR